MNTIVGQIDKSGSRYEQLVQIHDWLTNNNAYNTSVSDNIPCVLVSGTGILDSGSEGHMWNYVQMEDGKWYAVDVTWDDPVGGSGNQSGFEHHGYFLVGSDTVVDGRSFASSHQTDALKKPNGGGFVLPSLSTNAY